MIIFVHQPEYIPWIGFFDKLARCDLFVVYDDAQYVHGGYHNRNRIRTQNGWRWLTIPIVHNHPQMIKDVRISGRNWRKEHLQILRHNYEKTPYFENYFPLIEEAINFNHELLIDLNLHLLENITEILGIKVEVISSSEFSYYGKDKNEKLVSMCKLFGADIYLAGSGGRAYIEEKAFLNSNIKVQWHNYRHPKYKQQFEGFEPNMSIVDLLFNVGPQAKEVILNGGSIEENFCKAPLVAEIRQITVEQPQSNLVLPTG
ncbi:MAG: WbqC family protein [Candidatus Bathyarchaeia archaeon]|jgi:hypothetical protein